MPGTWQWGSAWQEQSEQEENGRSNADGQPIHTYTGVLTVKILKSTQAGW